MVEFKLVIANPKDGQSAQQEVKDQNAQRLIGVKIGDDVKGDVLGLTGYEFIVTGGSDYCGFPMRKDIPGVGRKRILAVSGVGVKAKGKGVRQRKTVCGNTIHAKISQVNLKILKAGSTNLFEKKADDKKEADKKEVPEKKEEVKKEEKPAEKPKEEKAAEKKA